MSSSPRRVNSAEAKTAAETEYDIAIVGGGIAGCALATGLAKSGRRVLLVERDLSEPDRIVGELLQPGGVRSLEKLGLGETLKGLDGTEVEGYEIFFGARQVRIPYPGGARGLSFHHGRFVHALREKAQMTPGVTLVEATVNELMKNDEGHVEGVLATPKTGSEPVAFHATLTLVADGCFSKFRKQLLPSHVKPVVRSTFVGLILKDADLPQPRHGHVILTDADAPPGALSIADKQGLSAKQRAQLTKPVGPILIYQLDPHETRILIDIPGDVPSSSNGDLARYLKHVVPPVLPKSVLPSFSRAVEASLSSDPEEAARRRLRSMPNSFLPPYPQGRTLQGAFLVGDSLNMRHPLTGGGMTVAFDDCSLLIELLGGDQTDPELKIVPPKVIDLSNWDDVSDGLETWHWKRKNTSTCINTLAMALYSLFGADNENLQVLKEGCFGYFERGGESVEGPISLLSALKPSPLLLAYHFFYVAFYSLYLLFVRPDPKTGIVPSLTAYPGLFIRSIRVLYTATIVFVPVLWTEIQM